MSFFQPGHPWVLACVLGLGTVAVAQPRTFVLQNGAVFQGRVLQETDEFVDLELQKGRIRIARKWLIESQSTLAPKVTAGEKETGESTISKILSRTEARKTNTLPGLLRLGRLVRPLQATLPPLPSAGSPEEVALEFCRAIQAGRGAEALDVLADPESLLVCALPVYVKGVTSYTRKMAARQLQRVLSSSLTMPKVAEAYAGAKFTAQRLISVNGYERVEVTVHPPSGEPTAVVVGVADGLIVDLTFGPPPMPSVFAQIVVKMKAAGSRPQFLLPLLESLVPDVQRSAGALGLGEAGSDHKDERVWSMRPSDKSYVMSLPWVWEPATETEELSFVDLLLTTEKGTSAALVSSELFVLPFAELKSAFLASARTQAPDLEVMAEEEIKLDGLTAWRLRLRGTIEDQSGVYEVVLFAAAGRTFQLAAWTRSTDFDREEPTLNRFAASFKLGP